jgi:type IV pilus assembly protein PilM
MNLLPQASGTRPRLACEISPEGVVAARAADAVSPIEEVARVRLAEGAVAPGLKPGNLVDRLAVIEAVRRALEQIGVRSNGRGADLTLIIPDGAVRVLLLDFDALPTKLTEALPIVRFRLKKLLPFEADDAMVTFQVMSSGKAGVRVLAVAMPKDILREYETAVREAGFEPGAVLPSTLATLPGLSGGEPVLLANAAPWGITTAIVREGMLLLHRTVDLQPESVSVDQGAATFEDRIYSEDSFPERERVVLHESEVLPLPNLLTDEIAQAVSVAAAYFEDTLSLPPSTIWSAGPLGAEGLRGILTRTGVGDADGLQVRELVDGAAIPVGISASVPRSVLAGVVGALRG